MPDAAEQVFGARMSLIRQYVDILISRGIAWGVLGPHEAPRVWDRHVFNSVAVEGQIGAGALADVGSGAGLPGVPLAVLRPDLHVTLIEPLLRRATFLEHVVTELGLADQVAVVRSRAEDLAGPGSSRYPTVTCRALAPIERLVRWCWPLVAPGGRIVAIKGRSAADEVERDRQALVSLDLRASVEVCPAPGSSDPTYAVVIQAGG